MRLFSTHQTPISRFSPVVALLAAIAFASFQTAELSHQHMADDVAENCVLCKVDSSDAVLTGTAHVVFTSYNVTHNRALINSATAGYFIHKLPRAPPYFS